MKKRIVALCLAILLLALMLPTKTAWALSTQLDISGGNITIDTRGDYIIYDSQNLSTEHTITVSADANVTLDNVTIASSTSCAFLITNDATVHLTLVGENSLASDDDAAGLQVDEGNTIHIYGTDSDSLTANGGDSGAGIGGGLYADGGTIIIHGGAVTAKGGNCAAGIGGGSDGGGGSITIIGGSVDAVGDDGAGIGGGAGGGGGIITISGGTVEATGGFFCAGIGAGWMDEVVLPIDGGIITISGGTVTAKGGVAGAGIGGGIKSDGGEILICGGTVYATSAEGGAGIGGGYNGDGGNITISGGSVESTGGKYGAGIGSGLSDSAKQFVDGGTITITGGTVTAKGGSGGGDGPSRGAAGIGGGSWASGGVITIGSSNDEPPVVKATGSDGGAAIGSGGASESDPELGTGGTITINAGTVEAYASPSSIGWIGSGEGYTGEEPALIFINGGSVRADTTDVPQSGSNDSHGDALYRLPVAGFTPGAAVTSSSVLGITYGKPSVVHDDGKLYLWLASNSNPYAIEYRTRNSGTTVHGYASGLVKKEPNDTVCSVSINPNRGTYNKYAPAELSTYFARNINATLTSIGTLSSTADYTAGSVAEIAFGQSVYCNTYTFKTSYLDTLPLAMTVLPFNLNSGKLDYVISVIKPESHLPENPKSYLPVIPAFNGVILATDGKAKVETGITGTYSNGFLDVSVTDEEVRTKADWAQQAKKTGKKHLIAVEMRGMDSVRNADLMLTHASLDLLANAGASFSFRTSLAAMTFSPKGMSAIAKRSSDGALELNMRMLESSQLSPRVKQIVAEIPVYDFNILAGGRKLTTVPGGAVITVPYAAKPGQKTTKIYYIDSRRILRSVKAKVSTDGATFALNSF